ncbi:MAG: methyl-accepting chemotaxis protein [Paraglaciecola sp.]|nr:methyl-accepting chemotaxis protein [Paraglaciecola sp.]
MGSEVKFAQDEVLLSTTDLDSKITYANPRFCEVAGYKIEEMVGHPHNMVRHPDMPKMAFADLWKTIRGGGSWMGPVKNRCSDGNYYWVNAFVTPVKDENNKIFENQSIRTCPNRDVVDRADREYKKINSTGKSAALRKPIDLTAFIVPILFVLFFLNSFTIYQQGLDAVSSIMILLTLSLISGVIYWRVRYKKVLELAHEVFDNSFMAYMYSGSNEMLGHITLSLEMQKAKLSAVVGRVTDVSGKVRDNAEENNVSGAKVSSLLHKQVNEVAQVSVSMRQFSETIQELAENINKASTSADRTEQQTNLGKSKVQEAIGSIQKLDVQLKTASDQLGELVEGNNSIQAILSEINAIADQTNLLALNAAIEAARAGEHGRGFSVVADEVRSLAGRTQKSTEEITKRLAALQTISSQAVSAMEEGTNLSLLGVSLVKESGQTLDDISEEVSTLADLNRSISAAIEEQSVVAGQVSISVDSIKDLAEESGEHGQVSQRLSAELLEQINLQSVLVKQFA